MRRSASSRGCSLTDFHGDILRSWAEAAAASACALRRVKAAERRSASVHAARLRLFRGGAWAGRRTSGGSRPRRSDRGSGPSTSSHWNATPGIPSCCASGFTYCFLAAIDARSEEAHGVGLDDLVRAEQDFHFLDGGLGREVERRQRAGLAGALGVDADGFVAAAGPDFVGIGPVVGGRVQVSDLFRRRSQCNSSGRRRRR